jgi:hypothetical protein
MSSVLTFLAFGAAVAAGVGLLLHYDNWERDRQERRRTTRGGGRRA